jgi:hypothetical protein
MRVVTRHRASRRLLDWPAFRYADAISFRDDQDAIKLHHAGDRDAATAAFKRGLDLAPGHPGLLRALRRYT